MPVAFTLPDAAARGELRPLRNPTAHGTDADEAALAEIEEIEGRLMAFGLSMAELHLLEVEQTVAMGMSVEGTTALNQLGTTIRSGALIAKRWLRARADAAEDQKDKMH